MGSHLCAWVDQHLLRTILCYVRCKVLTLDSCFGAGPAAPTLVEVPKRARTESSAATGRAGAARCTLDADVAPASQLAPLLEHLQRAAGGTASPPCANTGGGASLEDARLEALQKLHAGSAHCQAGPVPSLHAGSAAAGVATHLGQPADTQGCAPMDVDTHDGKAGMVEAAACSSQDPPEDLQLDTPMKLPDTPSAAARELPGSAKLS